MEYLSNRSYTYHITASGPQHAFLMDGLTAYNGTMTRVNRSHYRYRKQETAPYGFRVETRQENLTVWVPKRPPQLNDSRPKTLTKEVFADGQSKFWRYDASERTHYRRESVHQQGGRAWGITDFLVSYHRLFIE